MNTTHNQDERAPDAPESGITKNHTVPFNKQMEMKVYRAATRLITLKEQCRKAGYTYETSILVRMIEDSARVAQALSERNVR